MPPSLASANSCFALAWRTSTRDEWHSVGFEVTTPSVGAPRAISTKMKYGGSGLAILSVSGDESAQPAIRLDRLGIPWQRRAVEGRAPRSSIGRLRQKFQTTRSKSGVSLRGRARMRQLSPADIPERNTFDVREVRS